MIQEGNILLSHTYYTGGINLIGKGAIPAGIRAVTKSYWNHAAIVVKHQGELWIFEADIHGARYTQTLADWIMQSELGARDYAVITENEYHKGKINDVLGAMYDLKALFIDQIWLKLTGKYLGHTVEFALDQIYCSELVLHIAGDKDSYRKTPQDVATKYKIDYIKYCAI